jgi:hypothetical protein
VRGEGVETDAGACIGGGSREVSNSVRDDDEDLKLSLTPSLPGKMTPLHPVRFNHQGA